ncbi:hypothetical protein PQJ75_30235 [Rhodoplanes sp. TEM]|uniref:Sulfur globule protein n=1 Tax=Rhodoplanes tepidamans TaxID=200616 RepID=A0ABT5JJY0_RHOTP|nr:MULTISPECIES: hypothetical protein [Rhodoplanes]MDC7789927.1 hypothetical protein [Rhodoplanes tepidamans]MDC7988034.1 hypothetical protein [Rhodoplanes sp. TEM]MDQ0358922.1 hypothetical protein [Rhodoplanes tepidamans]
MSALAIGATVMFFGATTTADAQRGGFRGGGGGFHGGGGMRMGGGGFAGPRMGGGGFRGGFAGPRMGGPRFVGGGGPRFVGRPGFVRGPRFYGGGARFVGGPRYVGRPIYRGGYPGWRRAYWGGRPYRWRRPWIAPVVVGAGFYGAGYYGSCWRWRFTPWGWRRVNVCGWGGPYWGAAYPWGW